MFDDDKELNAIVDKYTKGFSSQSKRLLRLLAFLVVSSCGTYIMLGDTDTAKDIADEAIAVLDGERKRKALDNIIKDTLNKTEEEMNK